MPPRKTGRVKPTPNLRPLGDRTPLQFVEFWLPRAIEQVRIDLDVALALEDDDESERMRTLLGEMENLCVAMDVEVPA